MSHEKDGLVLTLYPNARGFAFALFEGQFSPIDWGISEVAKRGGRTAACLRRLSILIDRYRPNCLVLRDGLSSSKPTQALLQAAEELAERKSVRGCRLSRQDIRRTFARVGSPTRYAIAKVIAGEVPAFAPLLPPPRKIWNGEDRRMGLFDAASLAFAYFAARSSAKPPS